MLLNPLVTLIFEFFLHTSVSKFNWGGEYTTTCFPTEKVTSFGQQLWTGRELNEIIKNLFVCWKIEKNLTKRGFKRLDVLKTNFISV